MKSSGPEGGWGDKMDVHSVVEFLRALFMIRWQKRVFAQAASLTDGLRFELSKGVLPSTTDTKPKN